MRGERAKTRQDTVREDNERASHEAAPLATVPPQEYVRDLKNMYILDNKIHVLTQSSIHSYLSVMERKYHV